MSVAMSFHPTSYAFQVVSFVQLIYIRWVSERIECTQCNGVSFYRVPESWLEPPSSLSTVKRRTGVLSPLHARCCPPTSTCPLAILCTSSFVSGRKRTRAGIYFIVYSDRLVASDLASPSITNKMSVTFDSFPWIPTNTCLVRAAHYTIMPERIIFMVIHDLSIYLGCELTAVLMWAESRPSRSTQSRIESARLDGA
jgi:hypothetical protein